MSAKTLGGRVAWSERTAGRGVEGGKVTVGGVEGKQVEGGARGRMNKAGRAGKWPRHRVGDAGVSSGDPGNADDVRGGVDDAGKRATGPEGVASSEESGESSRASDRVERVGRESGSDVGGEEQTRGVGG